MRKIACPLCQNDAGRPVRQRIYHHLTVTTVLCPTCGLVYHNPILEDSDRQALGLSHRELHTNEAIRPRTLQRVRQRLARQAAFLEHVVQPGWQTLEIGCGLGLFSDWLNRHGCVAVGVEPDRQQAEFARAQFGLEIIQSRFEDAVIDRTCNFLASSHVIEHVPEPRAFLSRLRALAAPGGLLFLETPNILAPKVSPRRVFSLAHNFYFSPPTLTAMLAQTGWQVVKTRVFYQDSFMVLARAAHVHDIRPDPQHAEEVWQSIVRHRTAYYLRLMFLWRKIPLWRRLRMYRYQDFPARAQPIKVSV